MRYELILTVSYILHALCIDDVLYRTYMIYSGKCMYHTMHNKKDHLPTSDGNQLVDIENHCHRPHDLLLLAKFTVSHINHIVT